MTSQAHCKGCGHFLSRDDQSKKDGYCQKCRLSILSGQKNSNINNGGKVIMKTWKKALIWISSILVFLLVILPLLAGGFRSWIIPLYKWGFDIKDTPQSVAVVDTPKSAASNTTAPAAPAATSAPAAPAAINSDEYRWGWDKKETKTLLPGYCVAGDVVYKDIKLYDEGGTNEATVVINNSSKGLSIYSEWGAGEFMLTDKDNSIPQIVSDEFGSGGDPDAKVVRIVIVTDAGIEQTWYNSKLEIINQQ